MNIFTRLWPAVGANDTRRTLALFNWSASLRLWYDNIMVVSGFAFVNFALALNIDREKVGYLVAVGFLACLLQPVGLLIANTIREKKQFALRISYCEPLCMMAMVVAVFFVPQAWRVPLVAAGVLLAAASVHTVKPMIDEWLASAIPAGIRARYLGRRLQIVSIISVAAMLLIGGITQGMTWITQHVPGIGSMGYGLLLIAGGSFGFAAVWVLRGAAMPSTSVSARLSWSSAPEVLRHAPFLRYLGAAIIYNTPFWLAAPYYQVFALTELRLPEIAIACCMCGYFILKILLLPLAGRWLDRLGPRLMIYLVSPLYVIFFLLYALASPERWWTVFIGWALIGIAEGGYSVAATSALYSVVPESTARPAYFAVYNIATSLVGMAGAAMSAWMLEHWLAHTSITIGSLTLSHFQLLFGISCALLIGCIFGTQLFPGKEPRKKQSGPRPQTALPAE